MGLSPQLITDDIYKKALKCYDSITKDVRLATRLRAIISAKDHGVGVVAKVFDVSTNTLRNWIKSFGSKGLDGLDYQQGRGRKSKLSDNHKEQILKWVKDNPNLTINAILIKLKEEFDIDSSKSAVHRILHQLKLSYITPRPVHHKQDKSSLEEFKKKSRAKN
jgi:transposase